MKSTWKDLPVYPLKDHHCTFVISQSSVSVLGISGTYSPNQSEKWIFPSAPAFSLTGRSKDSRSSQTPGDILYFLSVKYILKINITKQWIKWLHVTHISGPAAYSLPPMLGHNILVKSTAPSFSMYGRIKTGSFHEDMKKVLLNGSH